MSQPTQSKRALTPGQAPGAGDRLARILLGIAALGALVSFAAAFATVGEAGDATRVTAVHDLFAFPVYAGLFALLAWRPRGYTGVWEVLIVQKGVVSLALFIVWRDADDAVLTATVDAALTAILVVAYVAARAWTTWPGTHRG